MTDDVEDFLLSQVTITRRRINGEDGYTMSAIDTFGQEPGIVEVLGLLRIGEHIALQPDCDHESEDE